MRKMPSLKTIATGLLFLAIFVAYGCTKKADNAPKAENAPKADTTPKTDNAPPARYQMRGEVMSLDPALHIAVIRHQKIEGWMGAMTMEYPVKDLVEFQKLKEGEHIQATVFVKGDDYWVGEIREEPAASPDAAPPAK